jgi:hypothetical protein
VPLPHGAPAPLQLQVLLCRTLAYALQQLPSCNGPAPPQQEDDTTTTTTDDAVSSAPAAAAADAPKLLREPVPGAAAQQLARHVQAVVAAVQQLLEAAATPPELLGPLLQLLLEALRTNVSAVTGGQRRYSGSGVLSGSCVCASRRHSTRLSLLLFLHTQVLC